MVIARLASYLYLNLTYYNSPRLLPFSFSMPTCAVGISLPFVSNLTTPPSPFSCFPSSLPLITRTTGGRDEWDVAPSLSCNPVIPVPPSIHPLDPRFIPPIDPSHPPDTSPTTPTHTHTHLTCQSNKLKGKVSIVVSDPGPGITWYRIQTEFCFNFSQYHVIEILYIHYFSSCFPLCSKSGEVNLLSSIKYKYRWKLQVWGNCVSVCLSKTVYMAEVVMCCCNKSTTQQVSIVKTLWLSSS